MRYTIPPRPVAGLQWHLANCVACGEDHPFTWERDRNEWAEQHHAATGHVVDLRTETWHRQDPA